MLLSDIKLIFTEHKQDKIYSGDLVTKLIVLEDRPWSEYKYGQPITSNTLAKLLSIFEIKPRQIRIGLDNKKGYLLADFEDIFNRYTPWQNETSKQLTTDMGFSDFQAETSHKIFRFKNTLKAIPNKDCFGVSFQIGRMGKEHGLDDDSRKNKITTSKKITKDHRCCLKESNISNEHVTLSFVNAKEKLTPFFNDRNNDKSQDMQKSLSPKELIEKYFGKTRELSE